jgi:hypothetical protein
VLGSILWCGFIPKVPARTVKGILLSRSVTCGPSYQSVRRIQQERNSGPTR